jgi:hypothetical protein
MIGRISACFKSYGWNFALKPNDIGKELNRTVCFGISVGLLVKAFINMSEGAADRKTIELRQERLAMV